MKQPVKQLDCLKEFKNVLKVQSLQKKIMRWKISLNKVQQIDRYCRKSLLIDYYRLSEDFVDSLIRILPEDRREICRKMDINPYIVHTLFDYSRYSDCYQLYQFLNSTVDWSEISLLDFGCLVSDYGYFFGMLGARISICDVREHVDFASFRLTRADITHSVTYAPAAYPEVTMHQDFVVFSEVLEHLDDPYALLEACVSNKVGFIYTTCYPYGDDAYFGLTGHSRKAQQQTVMSINLLQRHYVEIPFIKFQRLWILKEIFSVDQIHFIHSLPIKD